MKKNYKSITIQSTNPLLIQALADMLHFNQGLFTDMLCDGYNMKRGKAETDISNLIITQE